MSQRHVHKQTSFGVVISFSKKKFFSVIMNRTIKLITFDITGTLLKFRKEPSVIYASIASKYGVFVEPNRMSTAFKTQWRELNQRTPNYGTCWQDWWTEFVVGTFRKAECTGSTSTGVLTEVAKEVITLFSGPECWVVMEGTEKLLSRLKHQNSGNGGSGSTPTVILGVISNFDPRLHEILRLKGIHSYFDFVLTSFEAQCSKPDPEIFHKALSLAARLDPSIVPSEAVHVGDNYALDYCGARSVGWNSILFEQSKSKNNDNVEYISIHSIEDLEKLFENNREFISAGDLS